MKTTQTRQHPDGFIRATYGEHAIGEQAPYFSVTGEIASRPSFADRSIVSCGCLHDDIAERFPELAPLVRWHLSADGIPMHYIANAKYWHDMHTGAVERRATDPDPEATFVHHCIELDGEQLAALLELPWDEVEPVLLDRVPALQSAYRKAIS